MTGAHSLAPNSKISLTLEADGTMSANAGCNNMAGGYTATGNVLTAPQLAMTMMACLDQAVAEQETWFAAFLASSPTWIYTDGKLTLTDGTDTIVLTAAATGADALDATGWMVVGLISKTATANSVTAVDPSLTPWVRFHAGDVAFNTSCNSGGGTAEITDSAITFGALRTTLIFCDGPSASTETAMLNVLQGATTYTLTDDPSGALLVIMSTDGTSGLQLTADPTVGADAFNTASATPPAATSSATTAGG